ncbi:MAG TPA: DUF4169 family protein [Xanthobacteraceae bacterium]|nr:DUF4169 family protein [Xanthobacteraceae bacterium]
MSDIINLRRVRKRMAREEAEQKAEAQRLKFGRTKTERDAEAAVTRLRDGFLDGHRRVRRDQQ